VTDLNRHNLIPFVEPLRMDFVDGNFVGKNTADELVKLVGVIGGFGDSAHNTWMKLPYCEDFHRVSMATTCPILMLGGPSREDPRQTYQDFATGMATRANVRGTLVGRNITFPGLEDPAAVAGAIHGIVHGGSSADEASAYTAAQRDVGLDFLTRYIG
jgi:DhnA family fructose-bisphosphate aldolase class Ia